MELGQLLNSLSAEDIRQLQNAAKGLLGEPAQNNEQGRTHDTIETPLPLPSPQTLQKIMKIAGMLSAQDDRIRFFTTLKPLLGEKRQKKADTAIMLLQMMRIQEALKKEEAEGAQNDGL